MDAVVLSGQDSSSSADNADAFVNKGFQTTTMFNNSSQIDGKVSVSNFFSYEPNYAAADFRAQYIRYIVVTQSVVSVESFCLAIFTISEDSTLLLWRQLNIPSFLASLYLPCFLQSHDVSDRCMPQSPILVTSIG